MNNLQDRTHFCYLILHLVEIQRCRIFRSYDRTPGLSHFLTNKQTIGTSSRGTGCKWSLTVAAVQSVCDLPRDRWQVPGHLLPCYLWGASTPPGAVWGRRWSSEGWWLYKSQASWGRQRVHTLWIEHILLPACACTLHPTHTHTHAHISSHKKPVWVFHSWQAAKAPKIASWDNKDFKWVNTSFITHLVVQKVTHTYKHTQRWSSSCHLVQKNPHFVQTLQIMGIYVSIHLVSI